MPWTFAAIILEDLFILEKLRTLMDKLVLFVLGTNIKLFWKTVKVCTKVLTLKTHNDQKSGFLKARNRELTKSVQIVSLDDGLYPDEGKKGVVAFYLKHISNRFLVEDNHSVFRVYKTSVRSMENVDIVAHECPDWDTFASDLQSSLATVAEGDIIVLKFAIENKPSFLDIKNNFAPLLRQIFIHHQSVPVIVLAIGSRGGPSCTCPMCTSDREMYVSSLEGLQLAKDIGLGATYLELSTTNPIYVKKYIGGLLEYYIMQTMKQKSAAAKEKRRTQALKVIPPILVQPEKLPVMSDEPSQYMSDIRSLLDHSQCVDVIFCTADLNPVSAAHRVVLCSVSSVFMALFGVISDEDVYDSCTQKTVKTLFTVYQEPAISSKNSPVRVIVKDALFHKCLPDILHFIYSGASQWQLVEDLLEEKLKVAEVAYVSHILKRILNKPGTDSHSRIPLWESLGFFFNNPSLADVIFQVEDTKIPAHRAVLAARCEVMAAMFSGSYMESNCALIPVYGISKDTFLAFLEFIYTDTVCPASVLQAMSLLICSEMYQVSRLQHICELSITTQLQTVPSRELASTSLNVVSLLKKAKFHNAESLYNWLLHFVATHYLIFSQKQEFQDLSEELDFVETHKWPSNNYLTQLEKYKRYVNSPKYRCAVM
ncbi:rho-related BTB domain-containing protein 3 isoform 2-T2 [Leptodactylus fuscus]|uniref:rho-related BTB domain-containing protein 3 isoform X2 n=1 Tax=Leptodactylus fuscus TaxID=238119 RepID=UPI003F4ECD47